MFECGIVNEDMVILYGGNNNWFVVYVYWYFKFYGYEKVKLFDGGCKKWEFDGCLLFSDLVSWLVIFYIVFLLDNMIWVFCDEVLVVINVKNFIDVCFFDEFFGKILVFVYLL